MLLKINWVSWEDEIATLSERLDQVIHCVPFQPCCDSVTLQFQCLFSFSVSCMTLWTLCSWRNSSHTWSCWAADGAFFLVLEESSQCCWQNNESVNTSLKVDNDIKYGYSASVLFCYWHKPKIVLKSCQKFRKITGRIMCIQHTRQQSKVVKECTSLLKVLWNII